MADIIQFKRGTAARWALIDPVLADGELGYEKDTKKGKFGDGTTIYSLLDYSIFPPVPTGGGADLVPLQDGYYAAQAATDTDAQYGDQKMILTPLYFMLLAKEDKRATTIKFNLSSGVASSFIRVGIYKLTSQTGLTRMLDFGQISCGGGGIISITGNVILQKGFLYFLVVKRDDGQGGVVFLRGFRDHSQRYVTTSPVTGWTNLDGQNYIFNGIGQGVLPATLTLPTAGTTAESNPFYKIELLT